METTIEDRKETLRRIAAIEIDAHRESEGFLGAALDGSLATGAVWPTSDLDFTILLHPGRLKRHFVEWGQRDGIPWHKHLTYPRTLRRLIDGCPDSFIQSARGPFNADANWLLDGLAVMELVEDPSGQLTEAKAFVSARRFAPDIREARVAAFLEELRRLKDRAQARYDEGNPRDAYGELSGGSGFGAVVVQIWAEATGRIYSGKEADRTLAEASIEAGFPEAHDLYHRLLDVQLERVAAAAPLFTALGETIGAVYDTIAGIASEDHPYHRNARVWGAYARYLCRTIGIAPERGNPGAMFGHGRGLDFWVLGQPRWIAEEIETAEMPGARALTEAVKEIETALHAATTALLDPEADDERARASLQAAEALYRLTEREAPRIARSSKRTVDRVESPSP